VIVVGGAVLCFGAVGLGIAALLKLMDLVEGRFGKEGLDRAGSWFVGTLLFAVFSLAVVMVFRWLMGWA
jgi:hypothetical protein